MSLKACGTSGVRCPVRWVGEGNLAQGEFRREKMANNAVEEGESLERTRKERGELGEGTVSEVRERD